MGLILPQKIEITLNRSTTRYYENIGYYIPRQRDKRGRLTVKEGTKITVDVLDLPKNSHELIEVSCDCCNKKITIKNQTFNLHNHEGKYYCNGCANGVLNSGENSKVWKKEKTQEEREDQRNYPEYYNFIKSVLARDNYTCVVCNKKGTGDLQVHHLDGYNWCKEKRTEQSNGVTLCEKCHKTFHSIYGKGYNTKKQFEEWLGEETFMQKEDHVLKVNARKVYSYEDNIVFNSVDDCSKSLSITNTRVYSVCNRVKQKRTYKKSSGEVVNCEYIICTVRGKHLFWFDEYLKLNDYEIKKIVNHGGTKRVICLNTNKIYNRMSEAKNDYPLINFKGIGMCCRGENHSCGLDPITKEPLKWMYYDDYLKLHNKKTS